MVQVSPYYTDKQVAKAVATVFGIPSAQPSSAPVAASFAIPDDAYEKVRDVLIWYVHHEYNLAAHGDGWTPFSMDGEVAVLRTLSESGEQVTLATLLKRDHGRSRLTICSASERTIADSGALLNLAEQYGNRLEAKL